MAVDARHKQYENALRQWELVRDCVKGSDAVKSRSGGNTDVGEGIWNAAGTRYLPAPNAADKSQENYGRYLAYRQRANFVNFTGQTKDGMLGMVFRKDVGVTLPTAIEYLEKDANGGGMGLKQFVRDAVGDILETGRYGILVDYPSAEEGLTAADVSALNLRATFAAYTAESIINWRTEVIGSVKRLTMVVLCEEHEEIDDDGFGAETEKLYRVLSIEDGVYVQRLYNEDGEPEPFGAEEDESGDIVGVYEVYPKMSNGSNWSEIPFVFIGSQNNDETIDQPPLYDIAEVNIAHYRNSADYEESCFLVGQPTPVISGLTQSWVDTVLKGTVALGSRAAIPLPEGGNAMLLQAAPNQMPLEGMREKESQIVKIGARLIQDAGGVETAEAARIRYAGQNSKLGALVGNIIEGIEKACEFALWFMTPSPTETADDGIEIDINRDFYDKSMDAQQIMASIALLDRGIIAVEDVRGSLRKAGIIERTDDEIDSEAELTSPIE